MKTLRTCIACVLGAGTLVEFLFWGGTGIGYTILFLVLLAAYYIACGFPKTNARHTAEHVGLAVISSALAVSYTLFANETLRFLNFPALVFIMSLLFLQGTVGRNYSWDRPAFHAELWTGYFVRPFACLPRPWKEISDLRKNGREKAEEDKEKSAAKRKILFQVLAALLAAIPVMFILFLLLSSSDPVFRDLFKPLYIWLSGLRIGEVMGRIILFILLIPFVASTVWSYRDSFTVCTSPGALSGVKTPLIPAASAITVLSMVNLLYLLYAVVQFGYFFGAWSGILPDGITPAVYARNGFFELAFISCINVFLLLLSIRLTRRERKAGLIIRCLSTCLLVLSCLQLISAMLRMRLYTQAFGLTQLRYFVSAFMILLAVFFVLLLLKEFIPSFPMFRSMVFAGAAALIILNYSVPDAQIARYNISHYISGELHSLDTKYITGLSADAKIILLENEVSLTAKNAGMKDAFLSIHSKKEMSDDDYRQGSWKMYNMSQEKLYQYLLKNS